MIKTVEYVFVPETDPEEEMYVPTEELEYIMLHRHNFVVVANGDNGTHYQSQKFYALEDAEDAFDDVFDFITDQSQHGEVVILETDGYNWNFVDIQFF